MKTLSKKEELLKKLEEKEDEIIDLQNAVLDLVKHNIDIRRALGIADVDLERNEIINLCTEYKEVYDKHRVAEVVV